MADPTPLNSPLSKESIRTELDELRSKSIWSVSQDWSGYSHLLASLGFKTETSPNNEQVALALRDACTRVFNEREGRYARLLFGLDPINARNSWKAAHAAARSYMYPGELASDVKQKFKTYNRSIVDLLSTDLSSGSVRDLDELDSHFHLPRIAYESAVLRWANGGSSTLLIAGDSGNGKSTVASRALMHLSVGAKPRSIQIDASSPVEIIRSVSALSLGKCISLQTAIDLLGKEMDKIGDCLLLLDNASSWQTIAPLVYRARKCIVTSESRIIPISVEHDCIIIDPMDVDESTELIQHFRPNEGVDDARALAVTLGGKPRLMLDCLGMYDESELTLPEMVSVIRSEQVRILQASGEAMSHRAVHILYEKYLDTLEQESPETALMLSVIAWLGNPRLPKSMLEDYYLNSSPYFAVSPELLTSANMKVNLKLLSRRFLIRNSTECVEVHPVTMRLFRDCTEGYAMRFENMTISRYKKLQLNRDGDSMEQHTLSTELLPWFWPVRVSLLRGDLLQFDRVLRESLLQFLYIAMLQIGNFEDYASLLQRMADNRRAYDLNPCGSLIGQAYEAGILARKELISYVSDNGWMSRLNESGQSQLALQLFLATDHVNSNADVTSAVANIQNISGAGFTYYDVKLVLMVLQWIGMDSATMILGENCYRTLTSYIIRLAAIPLVMRVVAQVRPDQVDVWAARLESESEKAESQLASAFVAESRGWLSVIRGDLSKARDYTRRALYLYNSVGWKRRAGELAVDEISMSMALGSQSLAGKYYAIADDQTINRVRIRLNQMILTMISGESDPNIGPSISQIKDTYLARLSSVPIYRLYLKCCILFEMNSGVNVNDVYFSELARVCGSWAMLDTADKWRNHLTIQPVETAKIRWLYDSAGA